MNDAEIAKLGDDDLLDHLRKKRAPILRMTTEELGLLFGFTYNEYDSLGREFAGTPFQKELYTDQKHFPTMAYPHTRHEAHTPKGIGKAADVLHGALRSLGMRIAAPFMPVTKELIGDEARIRIRRYDPEQQREVTVKDRPPTAQACAILDAVSDFNIHLKDLKGSRYRVRVPNKRTQVHYHKNSYSLLETALAIREQAIEAFGRGGHVTFTWIREVFSLQSVETITQVQEILREALAEQLPQKTLGDFRLILTTKERLRYARAVYERAHEARRDHALKQIRNTSEEKSRWDRHLVLPLAAIGEPTEGFRIQDTSDAATVLHMIPLAIDLHRYRFEEKYRHLIALPKQVEKRFGKLVADVFACAHMEDASQRLSIDGNLLQEAVAKNESVLEKLKSRPEGHDPELGVRKAVHLLVEAGLIDRR